MLSGRNSRGQCDLSRRLGVLPWSRDCHGKKLQNSSSCPLGHVLEEETLRHGFGPVTWSPIGKNWVSRDGALWSNRTQDGNRTNGALLSACGTPGSGLPSGESTTFPRRLASWAWSARDHFMRSGLTCNAGEQRLLGPDVAASGCIPIAPSSLRFF